MCSSVAANLTELNEQALPGLHFYLVLNLYRYATKPPSISAKHFEPVCVMVPVKTVCVLLEIFHMLSSR